MPSSSLTTQREYTRCDLPSRNGGSAPPMDRIQEVTHMRDLTGKQFVAAMVRNGFIKDGNRLNGFRHPDFPGVTFMSMAIRASLAVRFQDARGDQ